jgi:hydrogenase 3 maturation protease
MKDKTWKKGVRKPIAAADRVVVVGAGNRDKGDDGAGIAAAESLRKRLSPAQKRRVRVLLGGPAPENLTGKIRTLAPDLVVILDAALGGRRPGAVFRADPARISDDSVTTHAISLRWLARYIEESIGCPTVILGIQPKSMETGSDLTREVEKGISSAVDFLVENLAVSRGRPGGARPRRLKSSSA